MTHYIRDGLSYIKAIYEDINIYALTPNGKGRFEVKPPTIKRLKFLNARGEGIYFRPTDKDKIKGVFIDDCPIIPDTCTLAISTHPEYISAKGRYQIHWRLTRQVTSSEAQQVQEKLRDIYNGDRNAISGVQLRRLPGFTNPKYEGRPYIRVEYYNFNNYLVPDEYIEKQSHSFAQERRSQPIPYKTTTEKTLSDYNSGDKSVDEMKYIIYLLSHGYTDDEIKNRLLIESNIQERKSNPDKYIFHSIEKAKKYLDRDMNFQRKFF